MDSLRGTIPGACLKGRSHKQRAPPTEHTHAHEAPHDMHTRTHLHTHTYTPAHTHTHAYTPAHTRAHRQRDMRAHVRPRPPGTSLCIPPCPGTPRPAPAPQALVGEGGEAASPLHSGPAHAPCLGPGPCPCLARDLGRGRGRGHGRGHGPCRGRCSLGRGNESASGGAATNPCPCDGRGRGRGHGRSLHGMAWALRVRKQHMFVSRGHAGLRLASWTCSLAGRLTCRCMPVLA